MDGTGSVDGDPPMTERAARDPTEEIAERVEKVLMVRLILYSSATCLVCVLEAQTPLTHSSVLRQFSF